MYRIYCELKLNLRIKPKIRIVRNTPLPLGDTVNINQIWAMDFISDSLANGRYFRSLNVMDEHSREALCMEIDFSLPATKVVKALDQIIERFNRTTRDELFDINLFERLEDVQWLATQWMWDYNNERPHSSIGRVPPKQWLRAA